MAVKATLAGLMKYDVDTGQKVLPAEPGTVHAVPLREMDRRPLAPDFRSARRYATAWCGAHVKVVLPSEFAIDDPDACRDCAQAIGSGKPAPYQEDQYPWLREDEPSKPPKPRPPQVLSGYERYDQKLMTRRVGDYAFERHVEQSIPADPGPLHAVTYHGRAPNSPEFLDPRYALPTWCGTRCAVVTEFGFYDEDPGVCPECVKAYASGTPRPKDSRTD